ncbi:hypothetical protein MMC25_000981 [Agyrium rufum]|nr:hypothetical protein [Agyrium rufum]
MNTPFVGTSREADSDFYFSREHYMDGHAQFSSGRGSNMSRPRAMSSSARQSQEDIFLELAEKDAAVDSGRPRTADYRDGVSRSVLSPSRPAYTTKLSMENLARKNEENSLQGIRSDRESANLQTVRQNQRYAVTAHPLDTRYRTRMSYGAQKPQYSPARDAYESEGSPELPDLYNRRTPIPDRYSSVGSRYGYRSSTLPQYNSSPLTGRPSTRTEYSRPGTRTDHRDSAIDRPGDGTESTLSTNAPSTVWDEISILKSRLDQLERDKTMPQSSNAAISAATGQRPMTAETGVTTASSSPKRDAEKRSASPSASVFVAPTGPPPHPLLTSALQKTRAIICESTFTALEASVTDAQSVASMMGVGAPRNVSATPAERALRRKADNLCRSLTELCIALADTQTSSAASEKTRTLKGSPQKGEPPDLVNAKRTSTTESQRSASESVLSRLEARRSSTLGMNGNSQALRDRSSLTAQEIEARKEARRSIILHSRSTQVTTSPTTSVDTLPPTVRDFANTSTTPSGGLSRSSTVLQRPGRIVSEEPDGSRTVRPLSRAMTELHTSRTTRPQLVSRNYTSLPHSSQQIPLDQASPTQTSLPVRKSHYLPSTTNFSSSPLTPSQTLPSRYNLQDSPLTPEHQFPTAASTAGVMAASSRLRYLTSSTLGEPLSTPPSSAERESTTARLAKARQQRLEAMERDRNRERNGVDGSERIGVGVGGNSGGGLARSGNEAGKRSSVISNGGPLRTGKQRLEELRARAQSRMMGSVGGTVGNGSPTDNADGNHNGMGMGNGNGNEVRNGAEAENGGD